MKLKKQFSALLVAASLLTISAAPHAYATDIAQTAVENPAAALDALNLSDMPKEMAQELRGEWWIAPMAILGLGMLGYSWYLLAVDPSGQGSTGPAQAMRDESR